MTAQCGCLPTQFSNVMAAADFIVIIKIGRENSTFRNGEIIMNLRCIVDGMASDVRKMYAALGLISGEHIVQTDEPQDYT